MLKNLLLTFLFAAAVSQAAVKELISELTSEDLEQQTQARAELLALCSDAGAPDAPEGARREVCLEMCGILDAGAPAVEVLLPLLINLERIGGGESVETLALLMNHPDEHVRDAARRALAANPSDAAAQAIGARLKSRRARSPRETAGLVYALGERRQAGASRLIAGALNSSEAAVFTAAVKTLGMLNEDAGIEALLARRPREQGFRLALIDDVLLASGRPEVFERLLSEAESDELRAGALLGLILSGDISYAPKAMSSGRPVLQTAVVEAAVQGGESAVLEAAVGGLPGLPPHLQVQVLAALEVRGGSRYASAVEPLLASEDALVRGGVCRALARIGTAGSVPLLLADGSREAQRALGMLNADGVDAAFESAAAAGDPKARAAAVEVLAARGRTDLIPVFFEYGEEEDRTVSGAALKAVGEIGDDSCIEPMAAFMITAEQRPASRSALLALVQLMRRSADPENGVEILIAQMEGASPRSRANILKVLADTGSPAALEPIRTACGSDDEALRKAAVKALSGWKDVNGVAVMLAVAGDESTPLSGHVSLMRGVSRIYAAQRPAALSRAEIRKAMDVCRRNDERDALQASFDRAKQ